MTIVSDEEPRISRVKGVCVRAVLKGVCVRAVLKGACEPC